MDLRPALDPFTEEIKRLCLQKGFIAAGVADLTLFHSDPTLPKPAEIQQFSRAIVMALRVEDPIIGKVTRAPTAEYIEHYHPLHKTLDQMAEEVTVDLINRGYRALLVPASKYVDRATHRGLISHKALGRMAGLGWQGKSLLLTGRPGEAFACPSRCQRGEARPSRAGPPRLHSVD